MVKQTGEFTDIRIMDGAGIYATIRDLAGNDALNVALVDGSGNQVTSFGGTSMTDDAAFTAAASSVVPVGGIVTADSVDSGDVGAFAMLANRQQKVTVYDSSGVEATFGSGTQYTEADTDVSITGTAILWEDAADTLRAVSAAKPLPVGDAGGSLTVDGTVAVSSVGGTVAVTQSGTWDEVGINDSGNSITVDNGGTFAVQVDGAALTSLQLIDDPVVVLGTATYTEASSKGGVVAAVRRDADTTLVDTTNEFAPLIVDARGFLKVEAFSGEALPVTDNGGNLSVDWAGTAPPIGAGLEATALRVTVATDSTGVLSVDDNGASITVDNGGTFAVQATIAAGAAAIAKAEDVASADADVGVPAMAVRKATPVNTSGLDGDYEMLQMSAGRLWVDPSGVTLTVGSHAVTNAGTFAVQESGTQVQADDAVFTPATSKVSVVGAFADETSPDSVDEGDAGALRMTLDRFLRTVAQLGDTIRADGTSRSISRAAVAAATSGNNTLVTNSNGGLKIRVYAMALISAAANNVYFTSDAGGTVIFGGSTNKIQLAANSGFVLDYNPAGWFETAANHDVILNLSAASSVSGGILYAEV